MQRGGGKSAKIDRIGSGCYPFLRRFKMKEAVISGTVLPDGSLQLDRPVPLPPGPVELSVRPVTANRESVLQVLQDIWAESLRPGHKARSAEEIDRDLDELRGDAELRQRSIEALQVREATE
jgi:hypothetical protein